MVIENMIVILSRNLLIMSSIIPRNTLGDSFMNECWFLVEYDNVIGNIITIFLEHY